MRYFFIFGSAALIAASLLAQEPATTVPAAKPPQMENRGMPPRATPNDYQGHAKVGPITIGAEFMQHSLPLPDGVLVSEDYVVVEAGLFGPPGSRSTLNPDDFSLRINGKKNPHPSEAYALIYKSTKDPEWQPDEPVGEKSKTSINGGSKGGLSGGGANANDPPPIIHVPIKIQRGWESRIQKSAFPEGDRALPQAGLLFFRYTGKASGIHSLELMYSGPAGKVTIPLNPQ